MARKHVRGLPRRNVVPTEPHNDGQNVGYFPRTLRAMLLALCSSKPPLFIEAGMREAAHEALPIL
jgi:hypothetical protein